MFGLRPGVKANDPTPLKEGWMLLCRLFKLCDRGLYLSGRRKRSHFAGQPDSVPTGMDARFNEEAPAKPQLLSRRVYLRAQLDLHLVETGPGSISADELRDLRSRLLSTDGKQIAKELKCHIVAGLDPSGAPTDAASLHFNWSLPWVPAGESESLVAALRPLLLKAPNNFMTRVADWPRDPVAAVPTPAAAGASAGATAFGSTRRVTGGAADADRPARRSKGIPRPAAPAVLPPALASVAGCIVSDVEPCAAWPLGGWGLMLPLAPFLDLPADGKVDLSVKVRERTRADGDAGPYCYTLRVVQQSVTKNPMDEPVAKRVCVKGGISSQFCNLDFMMAVDEMSAALLWDRQGARDAAACRNATAAADATDGGAGVQEEEPCNQPGVGVGGQGGGEDAEGVGGSEPVDGRSGDKERAPLNVLPSMKVVWAPPSPATSFSWSWTFSFSEPLSVTTVDKWRRTGRLYIVVPVEDPVMDLI